MKNNDLEQLDLFFPTVAQITGKLSKAILCSPDPQEIVLIRKHLGVQSFVELDSSSWDLNKRCPEESDLVMASNVFMCSTDPVLWFKNACERTKWLVILDNCIAHRGNVEGETAVSTGDVMRYTMPPVMVARLPTAFDLNTISNRIMKIVPYGLYSHCGVPGYDRAISFIALIRGDL